MSRAIEQLPKTKNILDSLITEKELCERLGVSLVSVWKLRKTGKIGYYSIMKKIYYSQEQIDAYLISCEVQSHSRPTMPLLIKKF